MRIGRLFFLAEDDGGTGGPAPEAGSVNDLAGKLQHVAASYEGDLEESLRGDDFTGIEDVGKLYGAYKASKAQNEADRKALEGSLKIPGQDSTYEEVKEFFTKIGMPESAEDYKLGDFDLDPTEISVIKKNFMDTAHRSGLTKAQATAMWKHEAASYSAYRKVAENELTKLKESFDSRYDAQLKQEIPDSTRRAERITREKNTFTELVGKGGFGEYFSRTGLDLNPAFIHQFTSFYERYVTTDPVGAQGNKGMTYEQELKAKYPSMFR